MSMRIDSCKPFYFICDVENLTLAQAQTVFPTATKIQYMGRTSSNYGERFYLVWAGYEIYLSGQAVLGTTYRCMGNNPTSNALFALTTGQTVPTDKLRFIADFTPPASAKGDNLAEGESEKV